MDELPKSAKATRRVLLLDAMILVAATAAVLAVSRPQAGILGLEWMGMLSVWGVHSVIGAVLSAPVVFWGRRRVHWGLLDLLAFLLPFAVWGALLHASADGKSLANVVGEPFYFSFAIPVAALVRVIVGAHVEERACSISLVVLLSLVAAGVYWWTPWLPE
jgi:hypothetical protein